MKKKRNERFIFEQSKVLKVDWIMFVCIHVMPETNPRFRPDGNTFAKPKRWRDIVWQLSAMAMFSVEKMLHVWFRKQVVMQWWLHEVQQKRSVQFSILSGMTVMLWWFNVLKNWKDVWMSSQGNLEWGPKLRTIILSPSAVCGHEGLVRHCDCCGKRWTGSWSENTEHRRRTLTNLWATRNEMNSLQSFVMRKFAYNSAVYPPNLTMNIEDIEVFSKSCRCLPSWPKANKTFTCHLKKLKSILCN